ncbi:MAG: KH domain-containing protein [Patescibacteria group bacterium]|nr:KH domain-containing protein [Patescibacteria group bacterium]
MIMKDTLLYIISAIVDNPGEVSIDETEENGMINFAVNLAQEDIGKVIGKEGKVIRAIRNVMKIPAIKQGKRINISVNEKQ